MSAVTLASGSEETDWINVSIKSLISIGNASDSWTSGAVSVYGKRGSDADEDQFLIETFDSGEHVTRVFDVGMADGTTGIQLKFVGDSTDADIRITYS